MCRFFIVAGAVGGCSCAGSCESSCTEYMSGINLSWLTFSPNSTYWAFTGCKNPKLCSTGDGILAVEADGQPAGALFFEIFVAVTSLILGIVFSCGICSCACFGKPAECGADNQVPVVVAVPVGSAQPAQPDTESKQETQL